jgi:hypothetical protein
MSQQIKVFVDFQTFYLFTLFLLHFVCYRSVFHLITKTPLLSMLALMPATASVV